MIQFTMDGVAVSSPEVLANGREEFGRQNWLRLPKLLSPELAETIRAGVAQDGFEVPDVPSGDGASVYQGAYQAKGGKVGLDLRPGEAASLITNRTNDPALLDFVQTMTGSPPLERCIGRVFCLQPMEDDLPWHTDAEGGRLADLVIELSDKKHDGGEFQMRHKASHDIFNHVEQMEFGDGLLIRISPDIEHHYKAIRGTVPKVTFSGWFVPRA